MQATICRCRQVVRGSVAKADHGWLIELDLDSFHLELLDRSCKAGHTNLLFQLFTVLWRLQVDGADRNPRLRSLRRL